jgi:hypothetical protein
MKTVNKIQCFNPISVMATPIKVFVGSLNLKIMLGLTMKRSNQMLLASVLGISTLLSSYSYASSEELTQWLVVDELSIMESQLLELTPVIDENLSKATAIDAELGQLQVNLDSTEQQLQEALLIEDEALAQQLTNQYQTLQNLESLAIQELNAINVLVGELQLEEVEARQAYKTELNLVSQQIAQLSDSQIKSLTKTLERTNRKGITLDLNSDELQTLLDGGYSFQKTNLFVKAYVEEAKFLSKADELRTEAEATGNAKLLEQADKMEAKAVQKKLRFTDKAAGRKPKPKSSQKSDELRAEAEVTGNLKLLEKADKMDAKAAKKEAKEAKKADKKESKATNKAGKSKNKK